MNEEEKKAYDAAIAAAKEAQKQIDDLTSENAKVKSEAAGYRLEKKELKDKVTQYEDEKSNAEKTRLAEEGKHKERADLLEKQLSDQKLRFEQDKKSTLVEKLATEQGLIDPVCIALIKMDKITLNDQGEVVGAAEAITELKTKSPSLFKVVSADDTAAKAAADAAAAAAAKDPLATGSGKQNPSPGAQGSTSVAALPKLDYEAAKEKMING